MERSKIIAVLSFAILLTIPIFSPTLVQAKKADTLGMPDIPGTAQRFNLTDLAPHAFMHSFSVGSPQVLSFRNMTMQINANRNVALNITGDPGLQLGYFDLDLNLSSSLSLKVHAGVEPPKGVPGPGDGIHKYIEIEPNSTEGVRATLRLYIDHDTLRTELGRHVETQRLRWSFWNGTDWEPVGSWMDGDGFLVCKTSRLLSWTVRELRSPPTAPAPNVPGIPARVRAYNYTMVTPEGFTWTLRERRGAVFSFRNANMMFNSTRNMELNVSADAAVVQRLFRLEVRHEDPLRLNIRLQAHPPEGIQAVNKSLGIYFEIEPNSTVPLRARLGLLIEEEALEARLGRPVDPQRIAWTWWDGSEWQEVESYLDEDNVLNAETDHFSTWTLVEADIEELAAEPEPEPGPEPEPEPGKQPTPWLMYGGAVAIAVAALTIFIISRKI